MILVIDASVVVKWLINDPRREAGTEQATHLMARVTSGAIQTLQPPHWIGEVGAVLARASPRTATEDVALLCALDLAVTNEPLVLRQATELAIELNQHLFDTWYHAAALQTTDALLVTADERYLRGARRKGRIVDLMDWKL